MAIQYVGGQTQSITGSTATATTITFNLTGGLASTPAPGDLVIVSFGVSSTFNRTIGVNTAGYTEIAELYVSDTYDANLSVSWKFMGFTADTSVQVSATGDTIDGGAVVIQVFRGVDPNTPLDVTPTTATGGNTGVPNPAAITPTTANTDIVVIATTASTGGVTYTASYLNNFRWEVNTAATNDVTIGAGWVNGPAANTAYDPTTFTVVGSANTQSWATVTIALRELVPQTFGVWNFETAGTADFATVYTGASVVTGQGQTGTYCGATTIGNGSPNGFGFRPSNTIRTTSLYSQFKFKVDLTANPSSEQQITLATFRRNTATAVTDVRVVVTSSGTMTFLVADLVNVATLYFGTAIADNTWYDVEFSTVAGGSGASSVALAINGTTVYSSSTLSLGTDEIWYPEFSSLVTTPAGMAGTVYYDEIVLGVEPLPNYTWQPFKFETGNTSEFPLVFTGASVVTNQGQVGTYCGASIIGSGSPNGFGFKLTDTFNNSTIRLLYRCKLVITSGSVGETVVIANIGNVLQILATIASATTATVAVWDYFNPPTKLGADVTVTEGFWFTVELYAKRAGSGASEVSFYVDDQLGTNLTNLSLGTDVFNIIGVPSTSNTGTGTVYFDEIYLGKPVGSAPAETGRPKFWTGSEWAKKPLKVWTGSAWVEKPVKVWNGSSWVTVDTR